MTLVITILLMGLAAWVGFETGRRYQIGRKEVEAEGREVERERRGRRGTVKMNTLKIRR